MTNPTTAYFAVTDGLSSKEFVIKLVDSSTIADARLQLSGGSALKHIAGLIIPRPVFYNPNYNFHYDPSSITFFNSTIEPCNYAFQIIHNNVSAVGSSLLQNYRLCPYNSVLVKELDPEDFTTPVIVPKYYIITDNISYNNVIIKVENHGMIAIVDDMISGNLPDSHISGEVITSRISYNPIWDFYLDPDSIEFFISGFQNNNVSFNSVQSNLANIGNTFLPDRRVAPAKSYLVMQTESYDPEYVAPISYWQANLTHQSIIKNNEPYLKIPDWHGAYSLLSGTIPEGLILANTGVISGHVNIATPSLSDILTDYTYTLAIVDNSGFTKTVTYQTSVVLDRPYYSPNFEQYKIFNFGNHIKYFFTDHVMLSYPGSYWRLAQGTMPIGANITTLGELTISMPTNSRPFVRELFIRNDAPGIDSLEPEYWAQYLDNFMSETHTNDYQFMVELVTTANLVLTGHTVRFTWFEQPIWSSWFQVNYNYINLFPDDIFYFASISENENVEWITPSGLIGTIVNGEISRLAVSAQAQNREPILIDFATNSVNQFPQGLQLQDDGLIIGRVSFRCYEDDPVTCPVNNLYTFTLRAYSQNFDSYADREFSIQVLRLNNEPSDNIWINAYPYIPQRQLFYNLMKDPAVFPDELIYRPTDPWHGKANRIKILFATGLNSLSTADYETILDSNHYTKTLYFGNVKTAVCLNNNLQVEYEVVYVSIIDPMVGKDPVTQMPKPVARELDLRPFIANYYIENGNSYYILKPNSLDAMTNVIKQNVGQANPGQIPAWMTSLQPVPNQPGIFTDGIGFEPVVVLAYCVPGGSKSIALALRDFNWNEIEFEFDRYQLENRLSQFYDTSTDSYTAGIYTSLDSGTTTFDSNLTKIMEGIDNYADPETDDKYLKFPKFRVFK